MQLCERLQISGVPAIEFCSVLSIYMIFLYLILLTTFLSSPAKKNHFYKCIFWPSRMPCEWVINALFDHEVLIHNKNSDYFLFSNVAVKHCVTGRGNLRVEFSAG